MTLKGIDVSHWQGNIDWSKTKTYADFAILKAGHGRLSSQKDPTFETNYTGCKQNNIPVGVYWYSYAMSPDEAVLEAKACLEVIKGKQFEYPIYFDIEEQKQFALGKQTVSAIIRAFLTTVEKEGYWVGLYSSTSALNSYVENDIKIKYAIWVAHYAQRCGYTGQYGIWQHSVAGNSQWDIVNQKSVAGVQGECDLDYCYIDYPTAVKIAGLNGYSKTLPPNTSNVVTTTPDKKTANVTITVDGKTYEGVLTQE